MPFPTAPDLYKNYYAEQRMDEGELFCRFKDGGFCTENNQNRYAKKSAHYREKSVITDIFKFDVRCAREKGETV